jgi:hypothetical protein
VVRILTGGSAARLVAGWMKVAIAREPMSAGHRVDKSPHERRFMSMLPGGHAEIAGGS